MDYRMIIQKFQNSDCLKIQLRALDVAWKNLCQTSMMELSFADVGLSLAIDGSEDHKMKFQGQKRGKHTDFKY